MIGIIPPPWDHNFLVMMMSSSVSSAWHSSIGIIAAIGLLVLGPPSLQKKIKRAKKPDVCNPKKIRPLLNQWNVLTMLALSVAVLLGRGASTHAASTIDIKEVQQEDHLFQGDFTKGMGKVTARLLRGGSQDPETLLDDAPSIIFDMKDLLSTQLAKLDKMQESYKTGDLEAVGDTMKSLIGDYNGFKQLVSDASKISPELALPDIGGMVSEDFDVESVPTSALVELFDPDVYSLMAEHLHDFIPVLEKTGLTLLNLKNHRKLNEEDDSGGSDANAYFGSDYPNSYGTGSKKTDLHHRDFHKRSLIEIEKIERQLLSTTKKIKAKHSTSMFPRRLMNELNMSGRDHHRRLIENDPACQQCQEGDSGCSTCDRLRNCVNQLEPYDYAVLFAGTGFINEEGKLRVGSGSLKLFDAEASLTKKIVKIKELAAASQSTDTDECKELLEEFHTACDVDTCSNANDESFQMTVDDVCDAVNSPDLFDMEVIAEVFDDFGKIGGSYFLTEEFQTKAVNAYGYGGHGLCDVEWYDNTNRCPYVPETGVSETGKAGGYYPGDVIKNIPLHSWSGMHLSAILEDCGQLCAKDRDCEFWVREISGDTGNTCILKKNKSYPWKVASYYYTGDKSQHCDGTKNNIKELCRDHFEHNLKFDYFNEWSKSVKPEENPNQCDSAGIAVCAEFAIQFDKLYTAANQTRFPHGYSNPMRKDKNVPIYTSVDAPVTLTSIQGMEVLEKVNFPINYVFHTNSNHGTKEIVPDEYIFADLYDYEHDVDFPGVAKPSTATFTLTTAKSWLKCVHQTDDCVQFEEQVSSSEIHPITCCSDTATESLTWHPDWLGRENCPLHLIAPVYRPNPILAFCPVGTFEEAKKVCKRYGGRLCTTDEFNRCSQHSCGKRAWAAKFTVNNYIPAPTGCLSGLNNDQLAKHAMGSCDASRSFLLGAYTSIGLLTRYATEVTDTYADSDIPADELLPGTCCMDTAMTSEKFGYDYDPNSMTCKDRGLFHFGLSPDACKNAGGKWNRAPCHRLKKCIEKRPLQEPGLCRADNSTSCRLDSECNIVQPTTGTCGGPNSTQCETDDQCESDWTCKFEVGCNYVASAFEEFRKSNVIEDATKLERCEQVRQDLGFEADYLDDIYICSTFEERSCSEEFSEIDAIRGVPIPINLTPVTYTDIEYDDDEDLTFRALPDRSTTEFSLEKVNNQSPLSNGIKAMKVYNMWLDFWKETWQNLEEKTTVSWQYVCNSVLQGYGLCSLFYVPMLLINGANKFASISAHHFTALVIAQLEDELEDYGEVGFKNMIIMDKWISIALQTINKNMHTQHTDVRKNLQDRHELMENSINKYNMCLGNHVMFQISKTLANIHGVTNDTPEISDDCKDKLGVNTSGRRGLSDDDNSTDLALMEIGLPDGYNGVASELRDIEDKEGAIIHELYVIEDKELVMIEMMNNMTSAIETIEDKELVMIEMINNMTPAMDAILEKLDIDPEILQPTSKSAKEPLFDRHLLEDHIDLDRMDSVETECDELKMIVEAMESKLDSVEMEIKVTRKVMKEKAEKMEKTVDEIKEKAEKMEKTVDEMKEMMHKLLSAGGVAASG